jgi:REP element-mobilizing transposase RayT
MIRQRKNIRLKGYDYSKSGLYFITICCQGRETLFGQIENGKMILNEYGKIVEQEWIKTPKIRNNVKLHEFTVMPNHFHAIVHITYRILNKSNNGFFVGSYCNTTLQHKNGNTTLHKNNEKDDPLPGQSGNKRSPSNTLGAIVRGFESAVTKQINILRKTPGESVWQRNFHDHIIRNKTEYYKIKNYIVNNPDNWKNDIFFNNE